MKRIELRLLDEAEAARIVREILPEPDYGVEREEKATRGLVEQQRLFRRLLG